MSSRSLESIFQGNKPTIRTKSKKIFKKLLQKSLIFVFFLLTARVFAVCPADSLKKDTTHVFPTVEVMGEQIQSRISRALAPTNIIGRQEIEETGALQISEVLTFIPGMFIKDYGGLGGLKTISLRGTSAAQTLVLLDGMKLNSSQSGMVDLSTIPLFAIDEIETVRGGAAALFGSNSLGGAVSISTGKPSDSLSVSLRGNYGSFGTDGASALVSLPIQSSVLRFGVDFQSSKGDFPFQFNQFGENKIERRTNGDFTAISVLSQILSKIDGWKITGLVLADKAERGSPGAVVQGNIESANARLNDKSASFSARAEKNLSQSVQITLESSAHLSSEDYTDKGDFGGGISSHFAGQDYSISQRLKFIEEHALSELTAETAYSGLQGNFLQPDVGNYVHRQSFALAGRTEREFVIDEEKKVVLQAALRFDDYSNFGSAVSPLVSFGYFLNGISFRTQWSYNFRPPNFNELYYLNYGTANLKPERSHSVNFGSNLVLSQKISLEIEGFLINTQNEILSVPRSHVSWSAQNVGIGLTRGIEANLAGEIFDGSLNFRFAGTFQKATDESESSLTKGKQLVYVPQELVSGSISYKIGAFLLGGSTQFVGERFSLPNEDKNSKLSSYSVTKLFVALKLPNILKGEIRLDCDNISDFRYSVVKNYPMQGRSWKFSFSTNL